MSNIDELSKRIYFTNKFIDYLINVYVREYDIRKAGQTALLIGGCIDYNKYKYLCSLSRMDRQVQTGLLIKDNPEFEGVRKSIIAKAREDFMRCNDLSEADILSVKNDAVYVIKKVPKKLKFFDDQLEFVCKNTYTSYYRYYRTEMYYFNDIVSGDEYLDVKNISDQNLNYHSDYFMDFLMYVFNLAQSNSISEAISTLQNMMTRYINLDLSLEYYREFNARSEYKLNMSEFTDYYAKMLPEDIDLHVLDINQNLDIMRYLYKIYSSVYFGKK